MSAPVALDEFYVHATTAELEPRHLVLKDGDLFAVFDRFGDLDPRGAGGLYHAGTRHLSRWSLRLCGCRPALLSSTVVEDNVLLAVDLTNPDIERERRVELPRGTVHVFRGTFLHDGALHERLRVEHFGDQPVDVTLRFDADADFHDVFEVRGTHRTKRGTLQPIALQQDGMTFRYEGLDGETRQTRIQLSPPPDRVQEGRMELSFRLEPRESRELHLVVRCNEDGLSPGAVDYAEGRRSASRAVEAARRAESRLTSSNALFNTWIARSFADLRMLVTSTPQGPYVYAGVPWYSTPFGRDGLLTALQTLWVAPELARGTLRFLAAHQATQSDPERDAEPGKIVHELRHGEMAALGEVPFGRYYGTVDATPLFVVLAGAYFRATGDRAFVEALWPNVLAALGWIDRTASHDADGFVAYGRQRATGLRNQGWKDSYDAIFHADGALADAPIALCEVQGYVFAARRAAAMLARVLGDEPFAVKLEEDAEALRRAFETRFWCEELGTYALAIDGSRKPCAVRSSNAGHLLFTGIAAAERARRVLAGLGSPAFFSGWGVRTIAEGEARYNPMSYHDGSIWPHDNAFIAWGAAHYGDRELARRITTALFEASASFDLTRMPELFCGFLRREGEGPTLYPVACSPQAWAAGAPFLLLQACLGLEQDAAKQRLWLRRPELPEGVDELRVQGLRVGEARLDLLVSRGANAASVQVLGRTGPVEVIVVA